MAQPPLSRQIKLLEEELGVDLFERVGRGIRLTDAGRYFLDQTENLTQKLEEVIKATQRIGRKDKRWFGLGFVPSTLYGFMPQYIARLRELDTQVDIGLIEMTTLQQFDALKSGRIDLGIGRITLHDSEIERLILRDERIAVALPIHHRLANRAVLTLKDVAPEPIILYPARPRPSYADHLLSLFKNKGHTPNVVQEVNELQTAIGLVAAKVGLALVPESVRNLHRDDVAYVALDEPGFTTPVMLSWRKNDESVFLKAVVKLARTMASNKKAPDGA
jgi:DNA-binding transcriptional LysR family regulator